MTTRFKGGGSPIDRYDNFDDLFSSFFPNDIKRDNSFPGRKPRSAFRERLKNRTEEPRHSSSGRFGEHLKKDETRNNSCAKETGEDILNRLKNQLRKESDMYCHPDPRWDYDMHSRKVDDSEDWFPKGFDDMRARRHMFRMPNWMTDDNDVSNLASRMSQSPHFSSMGRRGNPWRERRNSGGSAMSGTSEEDSVDGHHSDRSSHSSGCPTAVTIPIRIEAECPPGCQPVPPQQTPQHLQPQEQRGKEDPNAQHCIGQLRKQPQYASKTMSAVDALKQEELPRNTRCSSAPPDMTELDQGQRFISKTNITPSNPNDRTLSTSPVFNNVAKPFVSPSKVQETTPPTAEKENLSGTNNQENQFNPQMRNDSQKEHYSQHHPQQQQQYTPPQHPQPQPSEPQYYPQEYHHPHHQQSYHPPHQQWENSGHKSGVVRNIPIFIEGRGNNKPKDASPPCRSPPNTEPQHKHQQSRPHWERDTPFHEPFGFGSTHGLSNQDPFFGIPRSHHSQTQPHQQFFSPPQQQSNQQPFSHHQSQQPQPQHSHPQPPHPQPQHPHPQPQKESTPPPAPAEPKDIKLDQIATVRESVAKLQESAKNFHGTEKNKEYLYFDEMLTRALIQLDNIDPDGRDDVRQARRSLIKDINATISQLEKQVTQPLPEDKPSEDISEPNEAEKSNSDMQEERIAPETKDLEKPQELAENDEQNVVNKTFDDANMCTETNTVTTNVPDQLTGIDKTGAVITEPVQGKQQDEQTLQQQETNLEPMSVDAEQSQMLENTNMNPNSIESEGIDLKNIPVT